MLEYQLLKDLLAEQRKTNELLNQLLSKGAEDHATAAPEARSKRNYTRHK